MRKLLNVVSFITPESNNTTIQTEFSIDIWEISENSKNAHINLPYQKYLDAYTCQIHTKKIWTIFWNIWCTYLVIAHFHNKKLNPKHK